jgi:hypothetical protein
MFESPHLRKLVTRWQLDVFQRYQLDLRFPPLAPEIP